MPADAARGPIAERTRRRCDVGGRVLLCVAVALAISLLALVPVDAAAHPGTPLAPHDLRSWQTWLPHPLVALGIGGAAWLYARGITEIARRTGWRRGAWGWRAAAYGGGLLTLAAALASPLERLSGVLLGAHMVQHLVLILVAAPLIVLGMPEVPVVRALPGPVRRALVRLRRRRAARAALGLMLTLPVVVALHAGTFVVWHLPALYERAVTVAPLHVLEHVCFFGTAMLFWRVVIPTGTRAGMRLGGSVLALFLMALAGSGLGALMTFAPTPWYPSYANGASAWAISPLMDQRVAGLIMWMPGGVVYAFAAVGLFVAWLRAVERAMERRERPGASDRSARVHHGEEPVGRSAAPALPQAADVREGR